MKYYLYKIDKDLAKQIENVTTEEELSSLVDMYDRKYRIYEENRKQTLLPREHKLIEFNKRVHPEIFEKVGAPLFWNDDLANKYPKYKFRVCYNNYAEAMLINLARVYSDVMGKSHKDLAQAAKDLDEKLSSEENIVVTDEDKKKIHDIYTTLVWIETQWNRFCFIPYSKSVLSDGKSYEQIYFNLQYLLKTLDLNQYALLFVIENDEV